MGRKVKLPFKNGAYKNLDEQEVDMKDTKIIDGYLNENGSLVKRPGLASFASLGESAQVDGLYWWSNESIGVAVCNQKIFKLSDNAGTNSDITSDGLEATTRTTFATDGTNLVMANGGRMITCTSDTTTSYIGDADAPTTVTHVIWLDEYIVANNQDTKFYWSAIRDVTTWSALSFARAGMKPDNADAIYEGWKEIYVIGKESMEVWFNDGSTPFRVLAGASIDRGCAAKYSVVKANNTWYWLDHTHKFMTLQGRTPVVISTPFDKYIQTFTTVSDCMGDVIDIAGRNFIVWHFPTQGTTLVYDYVLKQWYEWQYWRTTVAKHERWWGNCYCYAEGWNKHLIGDRNNTGSVFELSPTTYTDNSDKIRTVIQTGHISYGTYQRKRCNKLTLKVKSGVGNTTVTTPKMMVKWKNDNGGWSNEKHVSLKAIGNYEFIGHLYGCGMYRTRQWEFSHSDQSAFILIDAEEDIDLMMS